MTYDAALDIGVRSLVLCVIDDGGGQTDCPTPAAHARSPAAARGRGSDRRGAFIG